LKCNEYEKSKEVVKIGVKDLEITEKKLKEINSVLENRVIKY
jgi:hypothetical protein